MVSHCARRAREAYALPAADTASATASAAPTETPFTASRMTTSTRHLQQAVAYPTLSAGRRKAESMSSRGEEGSGSTKSSAGSRAVAHAAVDARNRGRHGGGDAGASAA